MKKISILLFGLSLLFSWDLHAQLSISGTVLNEVGKPLPAATVTLKAHFINPKGKISDASGKFAFHNLETGVYTLIVRYLGYASLVQEINLIKNEVLSLQMEEMEIIEEDILISALRIGDDVPMAASEISKEELEKVNLGQDLPMLIKHSPSVVVTSDAGAGVGYTGIRVRGSDASRVNVTLNGIPLNDPESHGVWWVNMPDFASSVEGIQIQRGVGTSTNGAGAFGASLNIQTDKVSQAPFAELDNSYGSFNTHKHSLRFGSGLIKDRWSVSGRLSKIATEGYIDRASSDLKSYFLSGAYLDDRNLFKVNVFSGKEITYQAWWGTPESRINGDVEEMNAYYGRNSWALVQADSSNLLNSGRTYNYYTYDNETDNYQQDHYQALYSREINPKTTLNTALHLTRGRGYFEQFRRGDALADYGLENVISGGDTIATTDLIRRRWLDNWFYGTTFSLQHTANSKYVATFGGAANNYIGDHFGEVIWAEYASNGDIRHRYYDNRGKKNDVNIYFKQKYTIGKEWHTFLDLQYRTIGYSFLGFDNDLNNVTQEVRHHFFNPKAGLVWDMSENEKVYLSYSLGRKEPTRDEYVNSTPQSRPDEETLHDIEGGYKLWFKKKGYADVNLFYMHYKDQLVPTGQLNDVGAYVRGNIDQSYRTGVEISLKTPIRKRFEISGNVTWSLNRIRNFVDYIDNYDLGGQIRTEYGNTNISFSPSWIANAGLTYKPVKGLSLSLMSKYVSSQFLDNTSNDNRMLEAYWVNDLLATYSFHPKFMKEIRVSLLVNNFLNHEYEANGYTYSFQSGGEVVTENFYYPQAGTNFLMALGLKF